MFPRSYWLALGLVVVGMVIASLFAREAEARDTLQQLLAHDEWAAHRAERAEATWGTTRAGDPDELRLASLRHLRGLGGHWATLQLKTRDGWDVVYDDRAWQLRTAWAPALEDFSNAVHCRRMPNELPLVGWWRDVFRLEVHVRLLEGRPVDAVRTWLDLATFTVDGCDRFQHPRMAEGHARVMLELASWWDEATLCHYVRSSPAALNELAEGLRRLDRRLWHMPATERELAGYARYISSEAFDSTQTWRDRLSAWRHAFEPGRHQLDEIRRVLRAQVTLRPPSPDWSERQRQFKRLRAAVGVSTASHYVTILESTERARRRALGVVRLLRLAVARLRGEADQECLDPLGVDPIRTERGPRWVEYVLAEEFTGSRRRLRD